MAPKEDRPPTLPLEDVEARVAALIDRGLRRYGKGDLEGALGEWELALALDPDAKAAEEYITKAFKADKRFVYFFGHPWEQWYQQHDQAARYQPLLKKVQKIYGEKAASDPEHRGLLQRYAKQLASEVKS